MGGTPFFVKAAATCGRNMLYPFLFFKLLLLRDLLYERFLQYVAGPVQKVKITLSRKVINES